MASCLVLGAGLSGLTAATILQNHGWDVTVLDKGRGVGGRMATRRLGDGGRADHGAQFFSTKSNEWKAWNAQFLETGLTRTWFERGDNPRYVVSQGMSALPKKLAESLSVILGARAVRLEKKENKYAVTTEEGEVWEADYVVITFPAPQAMDFLQTSQIGLPHQKALACIEYAPCLTVMAVLDRVSAVPSPGGFSPETGPIGWIADNFSKGISPLPTVTIQATAAFSREQFDGPLDNVKQVLLNASTPFIGDREVLESTIHRWRYSLAEKKYPDFFYHEESLPGVYLGGDGFGEGHMEAAFLSGYHIASALIGK